MTIATTVLITVAITGFTLPEDIISIDTPVTINDSLVFGCLENSLNASELLAELAFPGRWDQESYATILPVHIAVPDRPSLILMIVDNTDETEGFLLSCSDQGSIIDSIPAYYWNSEGAESWNCIVDTRGSVTINIWRAEGWGDSITDTLFLDRNGYFTFTDTSALMQENTAGKLEKE